IGLLVSPDNRTVLAQRPDGEWSLSAVDGNSPPTPVAGHQGGDVAVQWAADGRAVFVGTSASVVPRRVIRLDLATGRREPWRNIGPTDLSGVGVTGGGSISFPVITPDGRAYAYRYLQILSDL